MPSRNRRPPPRTVSKGNWLRSDEPPRSRPWAYEELLFGSSGERGKAKEADDVEPDEERAELARLEHALDQQGSLIANLQAQLHKLTTAERDEPGDLGLRRSRPSQRTFSASESLASQRSRLLARCEGFKVDSPTGAVGWVEGIRFISRIDQPDLLEVRGGRFGRELFLIPSELVEEIRITEQLVVVRSAPVRSGDLFSQLADRLRRAVKLVPDAGHDNTAEPLDDWLRTSDEVSHHEGLR